MAVAAAGLQPLVQLVALHTAARAALKAEVARLAWSKEMRGDFA
jgi:hypothetical protein